MTLQDKMHFWNEYERNKFYKILDENPKLRVLFNSSWDWSDDEITGPDANKGILFTHLFYKIATENDLAGKI